MRKSVSEVISRLVMSYEEDRLSAPNKVNYGVSFIVNSIQKRNYCTWTELNLLLFVCYYNILKA